MLPCVTLNLPSEIDEFLGISIFLDVGFLPNDVYTEGFGVGYCLDVFGYAGLCLTVWWLGRLLVLGWAMCLAGC